MLYYTLFYIQNNHHRGISYYPTNRTLLPNPVHRVYVEFPGCLMSMCLCIYVYAYTYNSQRTPVDLTKQMYTNIPCICTYTNKLTNKTHPSQMAARTAMRYLLQRNITAASSLGIKRIRFSKRNQMRRLKKAKKEGRGEPTRRRRYKATILYPTLAIVFRLTHQI